MGVSIYSTMAGARRSTAKVREPAENIHFKAGLKERELPIIIAWLKTRASKGTKNEN